MRKFSNERTALPKKWPPNDALNLKTLGAAPIGSRPGIAVARLEKTPGGQHRLCALTDRPSTITLRTDIHSSLAATRTPDSSGGPTVPGALSECR
jgi:hypothetical protein